MCYVGFVKCVCLISRMWFLIACLAWPVGFSGLVRWGFGPSVRPSIRSFYISITYGAAAVACCWSTMSTESTTSTRMHVKRTSRASHFHISDLFSMALKRSRNGSLKTFAFGSAELVEWLFADSKVSYRLWYATESMLLTWIQSWRILLFIWWNIPHFYDLHVVYDSFLFWLSIIWHWGNVLVL